MSSRTRRWVAGAFAAAWMTLIFFLSELPGSAVPGRFGWLGHLLAYAVLAVLYLAALDPQLHAQKAAVLAVALASAYGILDEIHQLYTPGRSSDPLDWVVDTVGALAGVAVVFLIARRMAQRATSPAPGGVD